MTCSTSLMLRCSDGRRSSGSSWKGSGGTTTGTGPKTAHGRSPRRNPSPRWCSRLRNGGTTSPKPNTWTKPSSTQRRRSRAVSKLGTGTAPTGNGRSSPDTKSGDNSVTTTVAGSSSTSTPPPSSTRPPDLHRWNETPPLREHRRRQRRARPVLLLDPRPTRDPGDLRVPYPGVLIDLAEQVLGVDQMQRPAEQPRERQREPREVLLLG